MPKRGMSLAEKKDIMLDILRTHTDGEAAPYTLKELEKFGGKRKVNTMSIKDVMQQLVDDDIVILDKIGSTNYYWAFPSTAVANLQAKIAKFELEKVDFEAKATNLAKEQAELLKDRVPSEERTDALKKYHQAKVKQSELLAELEKCKENDPETVAALIKEVEQAKKAADRWTDNIWALMDHMKSKYGQEKTQIEKILEIDGSFDYPAYVPPKKRKKR